MFPFRNFREIVSHLMRINLSKRSKLPQPYSPLRSGEKIKVSENDIKTRNHNVRRKKEREEKRQKKEKKTKKNKENMKRKWKKERGTKTKEKIFKKEENEKEKKLK